MRPAGASISAARATTRCSRRCGCICGMPSPSSRAGARRRGRGARSSSRSAKARPPLPGYTHMQQAMPSSVAAVGRRFRGRVSRRRGGLAALRAAASTRTRWDRPPATACRGLPLDRERDARSARLRANAGAGDRRAALARQGRGAAAVRDRAADAGPRPARADLLLFYTQEFAFVELPDAFTTGSSIMPQKRNPDVFELVRGRSATALGCLQRSARASPRSSRRAISATCSCSRPRCSAGSTSRAETLAIMTPRCPAYASAPIGSVLGAGSTPPRVPTSSSSRRACRSAKRIGASRPSSRRRKRNEQPCAHLARRRGGACGVRVARGLRPARAVDAFGIPAPDPAPRQGRRCYSGVPAADGSARSRRADGTAARRRARRDAAPGGRRAPKKMSPQK